MKQFIDKLIERLEEYKRQHSGCKGVKCTKCKYEKHCFSGSASYKVLLDKIMKDVNQLAEEHKDNIQTIDVSELLGEQGNDGWIACSERLPEERFFDDGYVEPSDKVLVFTKYGDYKTSRYWGNRRNKRDYYDWLDIDYRKDEVIAWQPLPAPYQPKGE